MAKFIDRYTYRVTWSEEDQEYVGMCVEFPSLSWLEETQEEALSGIRSLVRECLGDMEENGELAPEPLATKKYSGKFMVRVPPETHRHLAMEAAEAGVSLNRLVASRLH
jgi:predicted HicB family RNase H-like nuclease